MGSIDGGRVPAFPAEVSRRSLRDLLNHRGADSDSLPETETRSSLGSMASPDDQMRVGTHNGHLMLAALRRHHDKPVIHLGETTLTGGEVARRISQYVQAFEELGRRSGHRGRAARAEPSRGALHPRRQPDPGLPAYVPAPLGERRRPRLRHQRRRDHRAGGRPGVHRAGARAAREVPGTQAGAHDRAGARGARSGWQGPGRGRRRLRAAAARGSLAAARPHDLDHLHRRHDGQAQGRDRPGRVVLDDDPDPARRVGVAGEPAVPHVYAAVARGCRVLRTDRHQGRVALRALEVRPGRGAGHDRGAEDHRDDAGARRCSTR